MSWLFGRKNKESKDQKKTVNPEQALQNIATQIDNISKRQQLLEVKAKKLTQEALAYKKAKNTKAAVLSLKKKKLLDQELNKIDGMKMLLEQQKVQLEGNRHNSKNRLDL